MLCSNRPDDFGPQFTLSSPIPTTCFVDVILVPLPVWIALALLPILILVSLHSRKANYNPSTAHLHLQPLRSCLYTITTTIYYVLIVCNILMQTLEIVRLSLIHFGIGLLPFAYVGLIIGGALHWSNGVQGRIQIWQGINAVIWLGGTTISVVKVVGLVKEGINGRKGSKYPISDQTIDVAVMAGVYAGIGMLEAILGLWRVNRGRSCGSLATASPVQHEALGGK
ncbi:hypothetical protein V494_00594 [Pseudogymnoascus sp. VKM F-4513 (FW-928)]|nr:hypothetical protein V494_00594 [Pseudogymnoascus sp. VKM F-4513 (FW-928)]